MIEALIDKLLLLNINIELAEHDKLRIHTDINDIPSDLLAEIRLRKEEIIKYLKENDSVEDYEKIPVAAAGQSYVLSSAQKRIWTLCQLEEGNIAYNIPGVYVFEEELDRSALEYAFDRLLERHESLRTVFRENEAQEIRQFVLSPEEAGFEIAYQDIRERKDQEAIAKAIIQSAFVESFDLSTGPLLRVKLLQLANDKWIFTYTVHHIISDGWSMDVLLNDLLLFYNAHTRGEAVSLAPLRIQYKDYAAWQQAQLNTASFNEHKTYWLKQFELPLPVLEFPADKVRPAIRNYNGSVVNRRINARLARGIRSLSEQQGGTLFMGLLAAINSLLFRYTNQEDIIIGSPIAGREHADLENQIGFYINTLALRTVFSGDNSFKELLENVKRVTLGAFAHQAYPFDELVNELPVQRDMSRNALFDVMVILQNTGIHDLKKERHLGNTKVSNYGHAEHVVSKFDLTFAFTEWEDGLQLNVEFNNDIFNKETIVQFVNHFEQLLEVIIEQPATPIAQLNFLSAEEKQLLLFGFNDTAVDYANDKTIIELFEAQVEKRPAATVLVFAEKSYTFRELNERSNQLAHYLRLTYHIQADDLIGIKLERSEWLVIAILGVLKSGGAYVPIDPQYPADRIDYMIADSKCKVVLDAAMFARFEEEKKHYTTDNPLHISKPADLAYVIYTSGSTGRPKGCMLQHSGIFNRLEWMWRQYAFSDKDIILQKTTFTFDVSVWELLMPLGWGCKMVLCQNEDIYSPERIIDLIAKHQVTCCHFVPAMFNSFIEVLLASDNDMVRIASLSKVFTSGEALPLKTVQAWYSRSSVPVYNLYGPTEASIDVSYYNTSAEASIIPIGRPVANTQLYILDRHLQPVPIGVSGEIFIGGVQLARGYLNQPVLTTEKFIPSPLGNGRLYRTGDIGRWHADGNIEYLGRIDDQVKIRGYRIELGEVEQVMLGHSDIRSGVVTVRQISDNKMLVGYVVKKEGTDVDAQSLRSYMKRQLPEYMVPASIIELPELPLTSNGKVDRKRLPDPDGKSKAEYEAPRHAMDAELIVMWEAVLSMKGIGIYTDFFEAGGHSLRAIRLINMYKKRFGIALTFRDLLSRSTIREQADWIASQTRVGYEVITRVVDQENYPISEAQRRLWVLSQFEESAIAYHMPVSLLLQGPLDRLAFEAALHAVIDRHEILRTVFREDKQHGEIRQYVLTEQELGFSMDYVDLELLQPSERESQVQEYINRETMRPFDLERGPLVRAGLLRLQQERYLFFYNIHHIISDAWSLEVLVRDVMKLYDGKKNDKETDLLPLRVHYRDYAVWQRSQAASEKMEISRQYWLNQLTGELAVLNLVGKGIRPAVKTHNGSTISFHWSNALTAGLRRVSREAGATVFMCLVAGLKGLFYRYTGQEDIIIGSTIAGREQEELTDQIGFYINTLALRTRLNGEDSFSQLLQREKETILDAYDHQGYSFDTLVDELKLRRDVSRSPVFDVLVNYQGTGMGILKKDESLSKIQVTSYGKNSDETTKFDLTFTFIENGAEGLIGTIQYNTDIYERSFVAKMLHHLEQLMTKVSTAPEEKIGTVGYLSKAEENTLLREFNNTAVNYPRDKTVLDLFTEQVKKKSGIRAVVSEDIALTFDELDALSNQVAHFLLQRGLVREEPVGLCIDRTAWMMVSMLGVLKAGGVYVPMDSSYPVERLHYMVKDAGTRWVLSKGEAQQLFLGMEGVQVIDVQDEAISSMSRHAVKTKVAGNQLAYVIYTSGSTGKPKGVMIEHASIINLIFSLHRNIYSKYEHDLHLALLSPFSFDASIKQIFASLIYGYTLHIVPDEVRMSAESLWKYYNQEHIDISDGTPAHLYILSNEPAFADNNIKHFIIGGEALTRKLAIQFYSLYNGASHIPVISNVYGPTEACVDASIFTLNDPHSLDSDTIPIGQPIANTRIYILDNNLQPVPIGITGELYIGGVQLARGYWKRPELTAEKFIPNPFGEGNLYRTGDMGRWLADGNIEYVGRKDDQVKIRGYRIELGEVEQAILSYAGVKTGVVTTYINGDHKALAAYIVKEEDAEFGMQDLRSYLKNLLPEYMVPASITALEALPLTVGGKIDRRQLPAPEDSITGVEFVAARNKVEEALIAVWKDVLKRDPISIRDDFYELGGDSIKAIQVVSRLRQRGYVLKASDILRYPQPELLTNQVRLIEREISQSAVTGEVMLTPVQQRFFEEKGMRSHYNQSVLLWKAGGIDVTGLRHSLKELLGHHDALRSIFYHHDNEWVQHISTIEEIKDVVEVTTMPESDIQLWADVLQKSLDPVTGVIVKAGVLRGEQGDHVLLVIHHLVIDGVSWRILLEDLSTLYQQYEAGKPFKLPPKSDSFLSWSQALKQYVHQPSLATESVYWLKLEEEGGKHMLPVDNPAGTNRVMDLESIHFTLNKEKTKLIQGVLHRAYGTDINDVLLTGLGLAIHDVFNQHQVTIGMEGHGREEVMGDVDVSRTIGWFTTMYPVLLDVGDGTNAIESLTEIKDMLRQVPNKGIGYGILRYLGKQPYNLQPAITFNYLGDFGEGTDSNDKGGRLFEFSGAYQGQEADAAIENDSVLTITGMITGGQLSISLRYSREQYSRIRIEQMRDSYQARLEELITALNETTGRHRTAGDYSYQGLHKEALKALRASGEIEDVYELAPLQEGIYYHWLSEPEGTTYVEQISYRVHGALNIELLRQSYAAIVERHAILRTSFHHEYTDRLIQVVRKTAGGGFFYEDLSYDEDRAQREAAVLRGSEQERSRGFNLQQCPLMRLTIYGLSENEFEFVWTHHHIVMDGWCGAILIKEFYELYRSLASGREIIADKVRPYREYIEWLRSQDKVASIQYWKHYLQHYEQLSSIPFKLPAQMVKPGFALQEQHVQLSKTQTTAIRRLCREAGITENSFIQGVWGVLLGHYNGVQDVVFGAVVSGRPGELAAVEGMVGLFINTIPVRIRYTKQTKVKELLKSIQQEAIDSAGHHYTSLSQVQKSNGPGNELLDHIMVFENYPVQEILEQQLGGEPTEKTQHTASLQVVSVQTIEQTNYGFNIIVKPGEAMQIALSYNGHAYDPLLIARIGDHIKQLVESFTADPDQLVATARYISTAEEQQLIQGFNNTAAAYPNNRTIITLFEEQVQKAPGKIAVISEDRVLTYKELDELSNQLAAYLQQKYSVELEDRVGIQLPRGPWMVISILGVMKAGGAYVPLDPAYPEQRVRYIAEDSQYKVLIDDRELEQFKTIAARFSKDPLAIKTNENNLAYVMYTSGSTGKPKGCMVEQKGIINRLEWMWRHYGFGENDIVLQKTTFTFDVSVWELLMPLGWGCKMILCTDEDVYSPERLIGLIERHQITSCHFVPGMFKAFIEVLSLSHNRARITSLTRIFTSGEALPLSTVQAWYNQSAVPVYNLYGPTEASIEVSHFDTNAGLIDSLTTILIGRPIANTQLYILDSQLQPVPVGVTGELYIGGVQLARGYLNRAGLTAEKFIPNPFGDGRLYHTGDLARWQKDSNIEYLGRMDDQVKIRGYRIELGEVEQVILGYKGIHTGVVTVHTAGEDKALVAYVVKEPNTLFDVQALRVYLRSQLPEYMVPGYIIEITELPVTGSGKIDRRRLPDPQGMVTNVAFVAARNEVEEALTAVWKEVLKRDRISILDNFYDLGGDSIKAIQVVSRLRQRGYVVKVSDILRYPEPETLGAVVRVIEREISQSVVTGEVLLTPVQRQFFEEKGLLSHYNQSILLWKQGGVNVTALLRSVKELLQHHDVLRSRFYRRGEEWIQEIGGIEQVSDVVEIIDLRGIDEWQQQMQAASDRLQKKVEPNSGQVIKAALIRRHEGDFVLLVVHHLVIDGVSWRILLEDLSTLYQQYEAGVPFKLPLKTDSFQFWAQTQQLYAQTPSLAAESVYWLKLEEEAKKLVLPVDKPEGSNRIKDLDSIHFVLDKEKTKAILGTIHRAYGTDINDVLLTTLGLAIRDVFNQHQVTIRMEGHGREEVMGDVDVSRTIGWFTTMYPVLLNVGEGTNAIESLTEIKDMLRQVPNKGIGYGILRYLGKQPYNLQPAITFNYLGDFGEGTGSNNKGGLLFEFSGAYHGREVADEMENESLLTVTGLVTSAQLNISFRYSREQYDRITIEHLRDRYRSAIEELITTLNAVEGRHRTVGDYSYQGLQREALKALRAAGDIEDIYELAPLQEGIYYHWLADPEATTYVEQVSYRIKGWLNIALLKQSYEQIVERHAILRTSFHHEYSDQLIQVVRKTVGDGFLYEDLRNEDNNELRAAAVLRGKEQERSRGFNLQQCPLMRLTIYDLDENEYEFVWTHHHILMDGWCGALLIKEFYQIYQQLVGGKDAKAMVVRPYRDYIEWLRAQDKAASLAYWKKYLGGYEQLSGIPFKRQPHSSQSSYALQQERFQWSATETADMRRLCRETGITENSFIQGVWGVLLSHYNGVQDVVYGSVVSGRPAEMTGVEDMVGLFINTIPVRIRYTSETKVRELLIGIQQSAIELAGHHYVSLTAVQKSSTSGNELLNHILVFENYPVQEMLEQHMGGEPKETIQQETQLQVLSVQTIEQTNYGFNIIVLPGDAMQIVLSYDSNVYDASLIAQIGAHIKQLAVSFTADPDQLVASAKYISRAEEEQVLHTFNNTAIDYANNKTIIELFEAQVKQAPERVALVFAGKEITYTELNERANRLGHYLRTMQGVKPNDLIAIKLLRSEWLVVAILGVMKSGGAYVPIDPRYPQERIDYMLADSGCKVVLDEGALAKFEQEIAAYAEDDLERVNSSSDLVYVLYTSGSTGIPKGCMLEHKGIVNRLEWMWRHYGFTKNDIILQKTTFTFDVSVWELLMPLGWGCKMVLCEEEDVYSPDRLIDLIERQQVTCCHFVPAMFNAFIDVLSVTENYRLRMGSLTKVMTSGEALLLNTVQAWYGLSTIPVYNLYGPTEASIDVSYYDVTPTATSIPIGRPVANTQLYILNDYRQPVPVGVPGEIYIGGVQLARGYLNRPELTAEKFIVNPFGHGRLYRTGDLGYWRANGNIEYLGRTDDQVKIRGYRIELGEVEQVMLGYEGIKTGVVTVYTTVDEKVLVGYVVKEEHAVIDVQELCTYMKALLPDYMVPAHIVSITELPLTSNGKVDRRRLPAPDNSEAAHKYTAPRHPVDAELKEIWESVLSVEGIGIDTGFFEAGGHSLRAIRLMNRCRKQFGIAIKLRDLLTRTTIREQADWIIQQKKVGYEPILPVPDQESYPVSEAQRRLWVLSRFEGAATAYHIPVSLVLQGCLHEDAFEAALKAVLQRHEILRTVFREQQYEEDVRQYVLPAEGLPFTMDYLDLRSGSEEMRQQQVQKYIDQESWRPFDLQEGPLVRAGLLRLEEKRYIFFYNIHHIISDAWSSEVLARDVLALYSSLITGQQAALPALPIQYRDYAVWLRSHAQAEVMEASRLYWLKQLSGELPVLELVSHGTRPAVKTYNGSSIRFQWHPSLTTRLQQLGRETGATVFMCLVAALKGLFYRYTGQQDIILGSTIAGRDQDELSDQIGYYVNTLALRTRFSADNNFRQLIDRVKEVVMEAYDHQGYPFDSLVEALDLRRDVSRSPVFDVLVNYRLGGAGILKQHSLPELAIHTYGRESYEVVKYDLAIHFIEEGQHGIRGSMEYNTDVYDSHFIEQLMEHFEQFVTALLSAPQQPIATVAYLSKPEEETLLHAFNNTSVPYPRNKTVIDLFREQVQKRPEQIAVVSEEGQLTYAALDALSDQLANELLQRGLQKEEAVGVCMDRSGWIVAAMLGIMKAGGAYVPMDSSYPPERLNYMLLDARARWVLSKGKEMQLFLNIAGIEVLDVQNHLVDNSSRKVVVVPVVSDQLAYVVYTSGSTGKPKGVMIEHRSLVNLVTWHNKQFNVSHSSRATACAGVGFDAFGWEVWPYLCTGASVYMLSDQTRLSSVELTAFYAAHDITHSFLPTGLIVELVKATKNKPLKLQYVLTGGDKLQAVDTTDLNYQLINNYGPTENTVVTTYYKLEFQDKQGIPPIGRPVDNTRVYILNNEQLMPVGVAGEICIGGESLARGYLNQPELTAAQFIENPFDEGVLYRTGDAGRWRKDGNIEYLGRIDDQVKIRGYRIEPGEVEQVLLGYPSVRTGIVVVREMDGEKALVAYVVKEEGADFDAGKIRSYMKAQLPDYMVPNYIVELPALPFNENGKLDRKALPEPAALESEVEYTAPRNEIELALAEIWEKELKREKIGIQDEFFALGGHSLNAVAVLFEIKRVFDVVLSIDLLFTEPTIEKIASEIQNMIWIKRSAQDLNEMDAEEVSI